MQNIGAKSQILFISKQPLAKPDCDLFGHILGDRPKMSLRLFGKFRWKEDKVLNLFCLIGGEMTDKSNNKQGAYFTKLFMRFQLYLPFVCCIAYIL